MTADQGFELHPAAAADIATIWEFISEQNLHAASRFRVDILDAIIALVPFPFQGHQRSDLTSRRLRFWTLRDYVIVYAPNEKPLLVVAVLHGRRSPACWLRSSGIGNEPRRKTPAPAYFPNASLFTT